MGSAAILAALVAALQAPGPDEAAASAALDAAIRTLPGYRAAEEPGPIGDEPFLIRAERDLIGAVPSEAELKAFIGDPDPRKRSALIARLVEDGRFAPFWASRFSRVFFPDPEKNQFTDILDKPPGIEVRVVRTFTAWLADRLEKDVPWTDIARAMLDARGTTDGDPALGYLLSFHRGEGAAVEFPLGLARHFLGIRLFCARCHDHPYDKWRVEDTYGLSAFVRRQQVRGVGNAVELKYAAEGEQQLPHVRGGSQAEVKLARGGVVRPTFLFGGTAGENDDQMKVLAGLLTSPSDLQFTRAWVNRVWSWLFTYGLVHPVDDFNLKHKALSPALLEALVRDTREHNHSLKRLLRVLCGTAAYAMPSPGEVPGAMTLRHYAKEKFERASSRPLTPGGGALPFSLDLPAGTLRLTPRNGARASFLLSDPAAKLPPAELQFHAGAVEAELLASLKNQFLVPPKVAPGALEGKVPVTWTELSGKYCCDRSLEEPTEYLIWLASFRAADGKAYHFRIQGPAETLSGWRPSIRSLLGNLGP